jgi:hypothetical protein
MSNIQRRLKLLADLHEAELKGDQAGAIAIARKIARNRSRRERDGAMRDLGLIKVRGNLGGTYWE